MLRCGWVFLQQTRIISGIQFTTHIIDFFVVETKQFVGSRQSAVHNSSVYTTALFTQQFCLHNSFVYTTVLFTQHFCKRKSHLKTLFEIAMALLTISVSFPSKSRFSATVNVSLTRQICGQRSSRAAESKRRALGNYFLSEFAICSRYQSVEETKT